MPYFMERKERTKDDFMPLNSLSKHSRKLKSHEQEMAELVFKTQLSTWTTHKLQQEWRSELDSSSDFDSGIGSWRDEDIVPNVSGESRLLSPVNTHRIEILQNSILGKEFQNVHSDDRQSLSSSVETVREDTNDSSVFESSTLADEETQLDLQKRHVEAFYHESQDIDRGFVPLYGCRKTEYLTYKREFSGLLETEGQEVEPNHPLAFDESSTKGAVSKRSLALGASAASNTTDLHTTESSASTVSKDTSLTSEVNSALNRGRKNPRLKEPMLCISAINPYILSKAPVLVHAMEMRKKLSKMFACIRCPARASIQESLGSRRYLLESSDFFALRDLVDLSKGAFSGTAALYTGAGYAAEFLKVLGEHVRASVYPMASVSSCNLEFPSFEEGQALFIAMEDMLKKIHIHITQLCSSCHLEAESCGV